MTGLVRVSNMSTFAKCERKGFLQVLQSEDSTSSQTFGTITHYILARWLMFAELPPRSIYEARSLIKRIKDLAADGDETAIDLLEKTGELVDTEVNEAAGVALKGLHLLPTPGAGLVVEEPFLAEAEGIRSAGIDLCDTRPVTQLKRHADGTPITIYDHKTCKTIAYVPLPEAMREDVQAISYAHELARRGFGMQQVIGCRWVYYPRSNDPAVAVDFKFTWAELQEKWGRIVRNRRRLGELIATCAPAPLGAGGADGWQQVLGNPDHCGDYGGCAYRNRCAALYTPQDNGNSLFNNPPQAGKGQDMGIMDRARNGEKIGASVSAPMPQAAAAPQTSASQSLFAKKVAANGMAAPQPASLPPPQTTQQLHDTLAMSLQAAGIDPPEEDETEDPGEVIDTETAEVQEALTVTSPSGKVLPVNPEASARVREVLAAADKAIAVGINPPDAAPSDNAPPEAPKKRGRPKKSATAEQVVQVTAGLTDNPDHVLESGETLGEALMAQQAIVVSESTEVLIVTKLRTRALNKRASDPAGALELFVTAEMIERGEL